jgi:endonuclease YncB( thermonuclease family)
LSARLGLENKRLGMESERMGMQRQQHLMQMEERLGEQLRLSREEMGKLGGEAASSTKGTEAIYAAIKNLPDANDQKQARIAATEIIAKPGMTTGAAIAAIMGIDTSWYTPDGSDRTVVANRADKLMETGDAQAAAKSLETRTGLIWEEQQRLRSKRDQISSVLNDAFTAKAQKKSPDAAVANQAAVAVGPTLAAAAALPGAPKAPVAVPSLLDGKPAQATHFSLSPNSSSKATPIAPIVVPENVNWGKTTTAVKAEKPGGEKAVVTYVQDGDTATLKRKNGADINCRIDAIDAPEMPNARRGRPGQPYGEESKRTLQGMIDRKEVTLTVTQEAAPGPKTKDNNWGRSLCKIEVEGVGVDRAMIEANAAWIYRKYGKAVDPSLEPAAAKAQAGKKGMWADPNPEEPWKYRQRYKD